jgi:hypothetical protein
VPAKDRYHDTVKRALEKDGWSIQYDQFTVILPERFLWIDIYAEKPSENIAVLIEIKGFTGSSPIESLASAVGKYVLYRTALESTGIDVPLYLAIPISAFDSIFSETIGRGLVNALNIRLLVFRPEEEGILQWIT